jgi:hypothetical protein
MNGACLDDEATTCSALVTEASATKFTLPLSRADDHAAADRVITRSNGLGFAVSEVLRLG